MIKAFKLLCEIVTKPFQIPYESTPMITSWVKVIKGRSSNLLLYFCPNYQYHQVVCLKALKTIDSSIVDLRAIIDQFKLTLCISTASFHFLSAFTLQVSMLLHIFVFKFPFRTYRFKSAL